MPEKEDLKMIDLLNNFRNDIIEIQEERSAKLFKPASLHLQEIYNLHAVNNQRFSKIGHYLKSLYTSFNYAAAIVNERLKKKSLESESIERLDECLEIMIRCCGVMIDELSKPSAPPATKKKKK